MFLFKTVSYMFFRILDVVLKTFPDRTVADVRSYMRIKLNNCCSKKLVAKPHAGF